MLRYLCFTGFLPVILKIWRFAIFQFLNISFHDIRVKRSELTGLCQYHGRILSAEATSLKKQATALKEETSKTIPADNTAGMVILKTDLIS